MKIVAFSKSFQDWPIPQMCQRFREIGLDGVDLTVREKGSIEPKNVETELPVAVKAAHEAGIEIDFISTNINAVTAEAEKVLATASKQGIARFKMGYVVYRPFGTLVEQMDEARRQIEAVAKLGRKYGILACMHIHSGRCVPSHGTMLYQLLRDFPPDLVGAYVDTLHTVYEGGGEGWRQGLDLLKPWITLCAVKNFAYFAGEKDKTGQVQWKTKVVPIAEGISPLPLFVATLKEAGFKGTFSLHSEYKGSHSFKDLDTEACLAQTVVDLKHFKGLVK